MFRFHKYHLVFIALLALLLCSAWLRPVWYDDAGHYLVIQQGIETNEFCHPTDLSAGECDSRSPFITLGAPLNHVYAAWMYCFGSGMGTARICTILFSLLGFLALFDLVKRFFSIEKAFWAVLLLIGNIQILSYGSQVLGEIPMIACLLAGTNFFLRWRDGGGLIMAVLAILCWLGAVFCKAYIAVPMAIAFGGWLLVALYKNEKEAGALFIPLIWGILATIGMVREQGGLEQFAIFLEERGSYANEFFTFEFWEALRFLAFKPLFLLGTLALGIRIYFQKRNEDIFLGMLHLSCSVFFLCSAGYDRLGMLLLFIPAIYLAEFCASLWRKWKRKLGLKGIYILIFLGFFVQQTPVIWVQDWPGRVTNEKAWRKNFDELQLIGMESIFTYDQHFAWLSHRNFRLPEVVPSAKDQCRTLQLRRGEWLLAGPYAFTEYQDCIPWNELELAVEVEEGGDPYSLYKRRD